MAASDIRERLQAALGDAYRIERELAPGGMSRLFLATERSLDRQVVIKLLPPELASEISAARFQREVTLTAHLQHPHILPILTSGSKDGLLYYVMPYVEGESLRQRLEREGKLPVAAAVQILREVADALARAHKAGIVHRDIKPENILLQDDHALLADFGVARALHEATGGNRLTDTGSGLGTPSYMAPEQLAGERNVDARADVYSLAVVGYEMLSGVAPFTGSTPQAVAAAHFTSAPKPLAQRRLEVPRPVSDAIGKALAKEPDHRFGSAAEFRDALAAVDQRPRTASRRTGWVAVALSALLVVGAAYVLTSWRARAHGPAGPPSLAVLPFENLGDSADAYFADGMTDEVRGKLGALPGIQVVASTSSNQYRRTTKPPEQIGRELGVRYLLVGRVRWQKTAGKSRVRVDPELIQVADVQRPTMRWEQPFDADLADVFRVQADIAEHVVSALRVALDTGERRSLEVRPTNSLEAYDLYLKGRYAWSQRTGAALLEAVRYFEQAIARDPRYAQAYAGLADAYVVLPIYSSVAPAEAWPKSRAAAQHALALDSTLAEAHATIGLGKMYYDWDWKSAERELQRAVALDPKYATGHQWYADYLGGRGRLEESLGELQRAQSLDPLSRVISLEVGRALGFMHRYGDAVTQIQQTVQLDPNFPTAHSYLGLAYLHLGRPKDAVAEMQKGVDLSERLWLNVAVLAYARARMGDRPAAEKLVEELRERARREYVPPTAFAIAYTGLGDHEQAFKWLNAAIDAHEPWLTEEPFDPMFDPLRSDARFREVRRRMGLE